MRPDEAGNAVSVVIPCFRCAATIGRAVESVASQTVRPGEVILVDDASGDETAGLLLRLREVHGGKWIHIVSLPANLGPGGARNAGWEAATGEWIAFLDADDAWHPRKIEIQLRFLGTHPLVVLCGHSALRGDIDSRVPEPPDPIRARTVTRRLLLLRNPFVTPSVMVRRDLALRFASERRFMEDHLLWMQIACAGHDIAALDAKLAFLYKAPFGEGGASARLWEMEKAELGNYRILFRQRAIGPFSLVALWCFSLAKFLRRVLIAAVPELRGELKPR